MQSSSYVLYTMYEQFSVEQFILNTRLKEQHENIRCKRNGKDGAKINRMLTTVPSSCAANGGSFSLTDGAV